MRTTMIILGAGALVLAWAGLPLLAGKSFFGHMIMHVTVVAIAAPLLAIGFAGGNFDPVRRWPRFFAPIPLSIAELVIVWSWHAPALHHAARHSPIPFAFEQGTFLLAGLLVWLSAFGGADKNSLERAGSGIVALLLTSMHMTLLGALLALTPRPLYQHHEGVHGLTAIADQQLGGAIMILLGGASYLLGGLWLSMLLLRERSKPAEVAA